MNSHRHDTGTDSETLRRRIVDALETDARQLDPNMDQALSRARRLALATPTPRAWWQSGMGMLTTAAGAVATAAIVATISLDLISAPGANRSGLPPAMPLSEDLDLVMRAEFDLLVEDPEFVAWLNDMPAPHASSVADHGEQSG